jgi:putative tricarboxylic transport membrane protein
MFEAAIDGLFLVLQWPAIGYLMLGVGLGIWLGAVPGLGGAIGLVIILPFTFDMEPVQAFSLLLGVFAVTSTGDTIASVMLGIPGTAASQATILDGYPMAMKGQAARALSAAYTVSMIGGILGAFVLAVSLPVILPVILAFAMPEFFMLAILGLAMVGALSGGSILKGFGAAMIGLLFSMVGYGQMTGRARFHFELEYLLDGLPLIPVVLGLFALPELMELAVRDTSISRVPKDQARGGGIRQGIRDAFDNRWLVIRCSAIGVYIGMIPGLGAAVVDWFAYGHTVQSAKDKSQFGLGDVRGVIGPESANNAVRGGSLIPTVAFGIPGSASNAILLSALLIQGLKPGTEMLVDKLDITFSMVWAIVIANIVAAGLLMVCTRQIAKVAFIRGHLILPGIILFVFMGAWMASADIGDWFALLCAGIIGFILKRAGWPRPPVILAMVLGPIMEQSFQISLQAFGNLFFLRPISIGIIGIIVITLVLSARGVIRNKTAPKSEQQLAGEGREKNPLLSAVVSLFGLFIFASAIIMSFKWHLSDKQFPWLASFPAVVFFACALFFDLKDWKKETESAGGFRLALNASVEKMLLKKCSELFGFLVLLPSQFLLDS